MSKNTRAVKEYTREQRLVKENKELKRELAHLRKEISKLDGSRLETLRQMCVDQEESQRFQDSTIETGSNLDDLKKNWACRECESGVLEITLYSKLGLTFYYRKCDSCNHRTKGKRYDSESVKGIIKNG